MGWAEIDNSEGKPSPEIMNEQWKGRGFSGCPVLSGMATGDFGYRTSRCGEGDKRCVPVTAGNRAVPVEIRLKTISEILIRARWLAVPACSEKSQISNRSFMPFNVRGGNHG